MEPWNCGKARGEAFTVTDKGQPVARLVPMTVEADQTDLRRAVEELIELRKRTATGGLGWQALRDEGRR